MADIFRPARRALGRAPSVRVTSPVLARYLDDLARQDKLASEWDALASAARGMDDALPPRGPVPPADLNVTIEGMMPSGPAEPFADVLRRNDRTRALVNSRLDRLTPEERAGSLGVVGRKAEADAYRSRRQAVESDMDLGTQLGMAAAAAALAGGFALKRGDDAEAEIMEADLARKRARDEAIDSRLQADVDAISIENLANPEGFYESPDSNALMQEALDSAGEGLDRMRRDRQDQERVLSDALSGDPDGAMPMTIDIGEDMLIEPYDPLPGMAEEAGLPGVDVAPSRSVSDAELNDASAAMLEMLFEDDPMLAIDRDSPDEALAAAPGPSIPVGMNRDLEDLPGPQMRSVKALMAAGIPEGRAMAIIVKGSSMSPDEYRMVTGGRR